MRPGRSQNTEAALSVLREMGAENDSCGGGGMRFEDTLLIRSSVEIILSKDRDKVGNMAKPTR